jgi:hypothetical protein
MTQMTQIRKLRNEAISKLGYVATDETRIFTDKELRNEAMRSVGRFNVLRKYETKPSDPKWAKRDEKRHRLPITQKGKLPNEPMRLFDPFYVRIFATWRLCVSHSFGAETDGDLRNSSLQLFAKRTHALETPSEGQWWAGDFAKRTHCLSMPKFSSTKSVKSAVKQTLRNEANSEGR